MESRLFLLVLAVIGGCTAKFNSNGLNPKVSPWNTLILDLLDDSRYQPYVRPYTTDGKALNVSHSIQLMRVASLVDHVLTLNTRITMAWKDERLAWNPDYYDNVREFRIPIQLIWHPDIVLYESVDERKSSFGIDSNAIVNYHGNVTFISQSTIRPQCNYETKTMKRHHNVTCKFRFGSWMYVRDVIDIYNTSDTINTEYSFCPNDIWTVTNSSVEREVLKYACCPEEYVFLIYSMTIKYTGN